MSTDDLHHFCGIAAIYHLSNRTASPLLPHHKIENASLLVPQMLLALQHRGQLAAGMTSYCPDRRKHLETYKESGTVQEVFKLHQKQEFSKIMEEHKAQAAIGHVRYATSGNEHRDSSQPFERKHSRRWKWYSFAFNGQLSNYQELRADFMQDEDRHLLQDTDSELLMHTISDALNTSEKPKTADLFARTASRLEGAWSLAYVNADGDMVVARDPMGFRPLCWAFDGALFAAASEDVALMNIGFKQEQIHSLAPGTLVHVTPTTDPQIIQFAESKKKARCALEWVYFASMASTIDDANIYRTRAQLGTALAQQEKQRGTVPLDDDTIVVAVPETSRVAADAMAHELGIRHKQGISLNRYVGRTFIVGDGDRGQRARMKYTLIPSVLKGKRIILVDDSIVRSTTMASLLDEIRNKGGAKEIHIRIACPPIIGPCFYGLDISTVSELFVPTNLGGKTCDAAGEKKLAEILGADSLAFLPLDDLHKAIGFPKDELCLACMNGEHPNKSGEKLYKLALADTLPKNIGCH